MCCTGHLCCHLLITCTAGQCFRFIIAIFVPIYKHPLYNSYILNVLSGAVRVVVTVEADTALCVTFAVLLLEF